MRYAEVQVTPGAQPDGRDRLRCPTALGPPGAAETVELARAGAWAGLCPEPTRRAILAEIDRLPIAADQPGQ